MGIQRRMKCYLTLAVILLMNLGWVGAKDLRVSEISANFKNPPDSVRPGVYWYFMDGNLSRDGITSDLESMKSVGIGHVVFLEVNVGVPRGNVDMMSDQWLDMFKHAVRESERLGIEMTLGVGPGWAGSGGPWVKPEQSMQHLVSTSTLVSGPASISLQLPVAAPRNPYFGEGVLTPELNAQWRQYYEDVAVLAYPTPEADARIEDIDEKALYYRAPYTSVKGVKPSLPAPVDFPSVSAGSVIDSQSIVDLTKHLKDDGSLHWEVPAGNWTIVRFGARNNGAITRPAPMPGLGFEADKFSTAAIEFHLDQYVGKLLRHVGEIDHSLPGGLKALHIDSWEMGAQNWTPEFRQEFKKRRGYDPQPYFPVYNGYVVDSVEISERFLWDLRVTSQELILENHAGYIKDYARRFGLKLSIEPYDMNPTADLELGAVADIPMCEFWSKGFGFDSAFSCLEAVSIAHVNGSSVVQAEAFTGDPDEAWKQFPGSMKNQGDWAFASGINRFFYHTFQHQPLDDSLKPGMAMGPYGVHWDRNQTFWPMVGDYHKYIARCQYVLQQGRTVADILYLTPEGAPHVFRPPLSAVAGEYPLPDRKGYNFDGCAPGQFMKASVENGRITFPGGASYAILVLPNTETMTPELIEKVKSLSDGGARIMGKLPLRSPSLVNHPDSDEKVQSIASGLKDRVLQGTPDGDFTTYDSTAQILKRAGIEEDFRTTASLRYTHRTASNLDIYFVSNTTTESVSADCEFRIADRSVELWDPMTGEIRPFNQYRTDDNATTIVLEFEPYQSYFVVFTGQPSKPVNSQAKRDFVRTTELQEIQGPWTVGFDPRWGGPESTTFYDLVDWSNHEMPGIRYYSGIATYKVGFDFDEQLTGTQLLLNLGEVREMARVRINGKDLGVVWTAPWHVDITHALKPGKNHLEIDVVNLWPNRLIGDQQLPNDGPEKVQWPDWMINKTTRPTDRVSFTTYDYYKKDAPLLRSGLLGPVKLLKVTED